MAWKEYSGDEHGYRELVKKHHPDAKVGRGHAEGVTQHTVGAQDHVVAHYDSHHKTGKVKVYEGTIMKKFSEFVTEAKTTSDHDKAVSIVKKHDHHVEEAEGDDDRLHLGGVHKKKVAALHKDLEKAGFKKQAEKVHPQHGMRTGGGGDGKVYHHFKKGNTSVHVADHPNAEAHGAHPFHAEWDHHFTEVHTKD